MKQVLMKIPRPIIKKLIDMRDTKGAADVTDDEATVFYASLRDALASKPLDER